MSLTKADPVQRAVDALRGRKDALRGATALIKVLPKGHTRIRVTMGRTGDQKELVIVTQQPLPLIDEDK